MLVAQVRFPEETALNEHTRIRSGCRTIAQGAPGRESSHGALRCAVRSVSSNSLRSKAVPFRAVLFVVTLAGLSACSAGQPQMETVDYVDLPRFMGDWYVIANIPTFVEKDAYNSVESYELNPDGTIATTFRFAVGGFDGEMKEYNPTGFIRNSETNALWGMQFVWPFKGDYRIVFVDEDYTQTIIGRQKRDFVWIMARTPTLSENDYERLLKVSEDLGYDRAKIQKVPQNWP